MTTIINSISNTNIKCISCGNDLLGKEYLIKDDHIYCEKDYDMLFLPRCDTCHYIIQEEQYISAIEKNYHIEHFYCHECKTKFPDEEIFNYKGKPYCKQCYEKYSLYCAKCQQKIDDVILQAFNRNWHKQCLVCYKCHEPFDDLTYTIASQQPYHISCYQADHFSKCIYCQDFIEDDSMVTVDKKAHLACSERSSKKIKPSYPENNLFRKIPQDSPIKTLPEQPDNDYENEFDENQLFYISPLRAEDRKLSVSTLSENDLMQGKHELPRVMNMKQYLGSPTKKTSAEPIPFKPIIPFKLTASTDSNKKNIEDNSPPIQIFSFSNQDDNLIGEEQNQRSTLFSRTVEYKPQAIGSPRLDKLDTLSPFVVQNSTRLSLTPKLEAKGKLALNFLKSEPSNSNKLSLKLKMESPHTQKNVKSNQSFIGYLERIFTPIQSSRQEYSIKKE